MLNVFRMFSRMQGERLAVASDAAVPLDVMMKSGVREQPDVSALAARSGRRVTILAWHYHDDDLPGPAASITLQLTGAPAGNPKLVRTLIDESHSNSFTAWLAMGSPQSPDAAQIRELEESSRLTAASGETQVTPAGNDCEIRFELMRQGVTLVELEWP